jgi:multisubunit Na+/H+ antiporter MnhG subunit
MSTVRHRELSWLNRARRSAGMDRNPLRRREDRIQSAAAILLAVLMLVAVPSAVILVGSGVYHSGLRAEAAERASRHQVTAQVMTQATDSGSATGMQSPQVSWKLPDGTQRTAPYSGLQSWDGSTRVWISRSGDLATPPRLHARTVAETVAAAIGTAALLSLTPLLAFWLLRRWLDRRRDRLWDADWAATDIDEGRPPRRRPDQP